MEWPTVYTRRRCGHIAKMLSSKVAVHGLFGAPGLSLHYLRTKDVASREMLQQIPDLLEIDDVYYRAVRFMGREIYVHRYRNVRFSCAECSVSIIHRRWPYAYRVVYETMTLATL